ncbi:MAG TPA: hypothetical protein VLT33_17765 [Labilithrix sp.]|nr:hypothetical protein [Labilithrix sp.]
MITRNVKGLLFSDYVRMIRSHKGVDWTKHLLREDLFYLRTPIEPLEWYPMETFERLGNAILHEVAGSDLEAVRMWGRMSVDQLRSASPNLVAEGDPVETMMRFRVQRATYFDFEALEIPTLVEDHAHVLIHYFMGAVAEEAASHQTMGFFERLLELAGATSISAVLREKSWRRDERTMLELAWRQGD